MKDSKRAIGVFYFKIIAIIFISLLTIINQCRVKNPTKSIRTRHPYQGQENMKLAKRGKIPDSRFILACIWFAEKSSHSVWLLGPSFSVVLWTNSQNQRQIYHFQWSFETILLVITLSFPISWISSMLLAMDEGSASLHGAVLQENTQEFNLNARPMKSRLFCFDASAGLDIRRSRRVQILFWQLAAYTPRSRFVNSRVSTQPAASWDF